MAHLSLAPLLSLFFAVPCPLCQRAGQPLLCRDCQQQLQDCRKPPELKQCSSGGPRSGGGKLGAGAEAHGSGLHPDYPAARSLVSWGRYEGKLKQAIAQLKYHNTPALADLLGEGLAEAWLQKQQLNRAGSQLRPWVVPVPMHREKQRQRGFNQAELIARSFCRYTGLPLLAQGLQRIQATQAQFELSPAERQRNVAQAFAIGPGLRKAQQQRHWSRQRSVLLLDDVYTTGATIGAISQVLADAQIPVAGVVAVAQATSKAQPQPPSSKISPKKRLRQLPRSQSRRWRAPAAGATATPADRP